MDTVTVFIADDHELVRMALRTLLEGEGDLAVIGEASDSAQALEGVCKHEPDVLLLDLRMPGIGGAGVCRQVKACSPKTAVLVLTSFDGDEELFGAIEAGADGYLLKDMAPEGIPRAVRMVSAGQSVFDTGIIPRLVSGRSSACPNDTLPEPLSERELEVLELMAQGMSNRDIAKQLWVSEPTVKTHVSHVLRKLGKSDRAQAVIAAFGMGLVEAVTDDHGSAEG